MMISPWIIPLLFLLSLNGGENAGDERSYAVAAIPPGLAGDAAAMIRENFVRVEVSSRKKASITFTRAITVFRREGKDEPEVVIHYDRFSSVGDLEGVLYDASGAEIRELEQGDIVDESDIGASSLYDDVRTRTAHLLHDKYPYTVVITYRLDCSGYFTFPSWVAQPGRLPVEHSKYEIVFPEGFRVRYWPLVDSLSPRMAPAGAGKSSFTWEARNLPELSDDDLAEDLEQRTAYVQIAPSDFELDGYRGEMSTWKGIGEWSRELYRKKNDLPPEAKRDVLAALAGAGSTREKINLLYRYMQARTRYVSVQLGIGGWEPFPASYVHQRGYGDCKALSNYMVALLETAGIPAYPALIYAGGYRSMTNELFPVRVFNHVIVCVPEARDTVWLECTSQLSPPGFLGSFTADRLALVVTPDGGSLVRTPSVVASGNGLHRKGRISLNEGGRGTGVIVVERSGDQAMGLRYLLRDGEARDKEQWLVNQFQVTGVTLARYTTQGMEKPDSPLAVTMVLDFPRLASTTGSRIFLQPNLTDRNDAAPKDRPHRKSPVRFSYCWLDTDSLRYSLPPRYGIEALPSPVSLTTDFGTFHSASTALGDTALLYTRRLEIKEKEIPASRYGEYAKFFRDVVRADKAQIVLVARP